MTQRDLADKIQITDKAVSKWERGKAQPEVQLLPAIAAYFHITIDELFYGIDYDSSDGLQETIKAYLENNAAGWDQIAHTAWRGTILPEYGPYALTEDALNLLGSFQNKRSAAVVNPSCTHPIMGLRNYTVWTFPQNRLKKPERFFTKSGLTLSCLSPLWNNTLASQPIILTAFIPSMALDGPWIWIKP